MTGRKFLSLLLVLVLALASVFAFAGCSKHPADESFTGAISAESYETKEEAAVAFVQQEINGKATNAIFVSYEKDKDLSEKEISNLNLGDKYSVSDVESAEMGEVTFEENVQTSYVGDDSVATLSSRAAEFGVVRKTSRMVIIKIGYVYLYYVPVFEKGEMITNSYISMILDYTKYRNMTEKSVSKSSVSLIGIKNETTITTTTKVTENALYSKIVTKAAEGSGIVELYVIERNSSLYAFQRTGEKENEMSSWKKVYFTYSSIESFLQNLFKFDHSYFERTKSGFKMSEDKLIAYVNDIMDNAFDSIGAEVTSGEVNYYVEDGRLSSSDVTMKMKVEAEGMKLNAKSTAECEWIDFGTTEIEIPAEITAML